MLKSTEKQAWYSVKEMAIYLGISKESMYRMVKAKEIPCHRIGKLWRFNREEIDKWILNNGKMK